MYFHEAANLTMFHMIYISEKLAKLMTELDLCYFVFWQKDRKSAIFGTGTHSRLEAFNKLNSLIADEQKTNGKGFFCYKISN